MKKLKNIVTRPVLVTLLLLAILTVNTYFTIRSLRNHIVEENLSVLRSSLDNLTDELNHVMSEDRKQLQLIAHMLASHDIKETEILSSLVSGYEIDGTVDELYLLLPDNRVIGPNGSCKDNNIPLDFKEEASKGVYISQKLDSFADIEEELIYQAVPVVQNGEAKAVLYGIVTLKDFPKDILYSHSYEKQQVYVMEGESGKMLLDTRHKTLTTTDNLNKHRENEKQEVKETKYELRHGVSGMNRFYSERAGENFYFCYRPVGINDWSMAVSLPESEVFKHMDEINEVLTIFTVIKFASILIYLAWTLNYNRREAASKEAELTQVNYILDIQSTLFNAHQSSEHMQRALEKISTKLKAEAAGFITLENSKVNKIYLWPPQGEEPPYQAFYNTVIHTELRRTGSCIVYDVEDLKDSSPELYHSLKQCHIRNFMMVLVGNADQRNVGVLGVWNTTVKWKNVRYLDYVAANFFLTYCNIKDQEKIQEMAAYDTLTGLLNRNSYEKELQDYENGAERPLACVYVDVNGLHEVNNNQGHTAGDEMLQFIGTAIQQIFGSRNAYRIGGDEFLTFIFEFSKEETKEKIRNLNEAVEDRNYHISVGLEYPEDNSDIGQMLEEAEKQMYQKKAEYYQKKGNDRRIRS